MAETRPIGEQLRFVSQFTGEHILDDYLESSEIGSRKLNDLLGDIFSSTDGAFRSDTFQFREDPANPGTFQVRIGQFINADTGWQTITFTDFAQYVADALSYNNAAETAKLAAESARDANDIANINTVSGQITGTKTYAVTASGGKFFLDGTTNPQITIKEGHTITFDLSDSSLSSHPFRLS